MPNWLVDTFVVVDTLLLLINLILLLLILSYTEQREREKDKKGGGRVGKDESWYTHLDNKPADLLAQKEEKKNGNF